MPAVNSFDAIAGVYDGLAGLVFGKSIRISQEVFLDKIIDARKILIIGGGTGWLLQTVLSQNRHGMITYLEASLKMLEKARQRCSEEQRRRVTFIHGTEATLSREKMYDVAIANFFFDMFDPSRLQSVIIRIKQSMLDGAALIVTDFTNSKRWWHAFLLRAMYAFFGVVAKLEAKTLPPWHEDLIAAGFERNSVVRFFDGFIEAGFYKKKALP